MTQAETHQHFSECVFDDQGWTCVTEGTRTEKWADGVACNHGTIKSDCEWCNPQRAETDPSVALLDTGRAAKIAAIHAFADWLADHPEVPAPTAVEGVWWSDHHDEIDEATRYAALESAANALGAPIYGDDMRIFQHRILDVPGMRITYEGAMLTDHYERKNGRL